MKLLLVTILFVLLPSDNWIDEAKERVKVLDLEAKFIKEKHISHDFWEGTITTYKLKKERLTVFNTFNSPVQDWTMNQKIYSRKNFVYADLVIMTAPHIYKGKSNIDLPVKLIIEENSYYKNKAEGFAFYREIDCFEGQDEDSLMLELQKLEFEERPLIEVDYNTSERIPKQMNKF
ncbi:MAG: hypothetical protein GQ574_00720 [Crocinitomix sp.]|nr:hypothetical protein [Crocinitomix sp.]